MCGISGSITKEKFENLSLIKKTLFLMKRRGPDNQNFYKRIEAGGGFTLNAEETITSDYVFIRARNSEFNYSTNPSYISGSTGELIYSEFINNPQVYLTTVGMYNDANECVAVAKLSKPLLKDFTKEALVRVKLDF